VQISNLLTRIKVSDGEVQQPTLQQFLDRVKELFPVEAPLDENESFLIGSAIDGQNFVAVWSTVHLRDLAKKQPCLQIDNTYKILYHGYPVMV
jgi:hypothetical protein